jgi:beta-N-acetylhexosaminidase
VQRVESLIKEMTAEEKVGQLLCIGVYGDEHGWASRDEETLIKKYHVGAVRIYGSRHNSVFCRQYINELQSWASSTRLGIPLIVSVDAEYGLYHEVNEGVSVFPTSSGIGACDSLEITRKVSEVIARESLAIGINMNQRPVADVNVNPLNPVIGVRAYGDDVDKVCDQVEASIIGAKSQGLITCAKHFPGHGDTQFDSHKELPIIDCDIEELKRVHLPPFLRAIKTGVDSIMTAHIITPCIDPDFPGTLSYNVMQGLLRDEMGFDGVLITDGMTMAAIKDNYTIEYAAVKAINSGVDLILSSYRDMDDHVLMYEAVLKAYRDGVISEERLNQSLRRVLKLKASRNWFESSRIGDIRGVLEVCGSDEHTKINEEALEKSMTLVKNEDAIPLKPQDRVLITGVNDVHGVGKALMDRGHMVMSYQLRTRRKDAMGSWADEDLKNVLSLSDNADVVVVLTYTHQGSLPSEQQRLLEALKEKKAKIIVVALGLPYDAANSEGISAYLLTYLQAYTRAYPNPLPDIFTKELADALTGVYKPTGKCPFRI